MSSAGAGRLRYPRSPRCTGTASSRSCPRAGPHCRLRRNRREFCPNRRHWHRRPIRRRHSRGVAPAETPHQGRRERHRCRREERSSGGHVRRTLDSAYTFIYGSARLRRCREAVTPNRRPRRTDRCRDRSGYRSVETGERVSQCQDRGKGIDIKYDRAAGWSRIVTLSTPRATVACVRPSPDRGIRRPGGDARGVGSQRACRASGGAGRDGRRPGGNRPRRWRRRRPRATTRVRWLVRRRVGTRGDGVRRDGRDRRARGRRGCGRHFASVSSVWDRWSPPRWSGARRGSSRESPFLPTVARSSAWPRRRRFRHSSTWRLRA